MGSKLTYLEDIADQTCKPPRLLEMPVDTTPTEVAKAYTQNKMASQAFPYQAHWNATSEAPGEHLEKK